MNFTSGLTYVGNSRDPDVVYYNATIINNNTAEGNQDDPVISFLETKNQAILSDTSQYEMAVTKVTLEGAQKTLPIFVPQIEIVTNTDASGVVYTTLPDVNQTVYTVTFGLTYEYSGLKKVYAVTKPVIWFTENVNAVVPQPQTAAPSPVGNTTNIPFAKQQISDYYYTYTYNHWLICVNTALKSAWSAANTLALNDLSGQTWWAADNYTTRLPRFEYDEVTKLFSVYTDAQDSVTGKTLGTNAVTLYSFIGYNTNFEGIMTNFDTQYYGDGYLYTTTSSPAFPSPPLPTPLTPGPGSDTEYPENVMVIRNKSGTNIQLGIDPTTGVGYDTAPASNEVAYVSYVTTQDFVSTGTLWSPISEVVLTTQFIPVRYEYTSAPIKSGQGNLAVAPSQTNVNGLLTDFTLREGSTSDDWRGYLRYEPNLHKIIPMSPSKDELKTIDIQMYWRYRLTNELIPMRIYNLGSVSIQLMFRLKGQDA